MFEYKSLVVFLVTSIIIVLLSIAFSYLYFVIVESFIRIVILNRLTKASFEVDGYNTVELTFCYFISLIFYLYLYSYLPKSAEGSLITIYPMIIFGLMLVYLGRIITRFKGVFYGRIYFSSIFISFFLLVLYNSARAVNLSTNLSYFYYIDFIQNYLDNFIAGYKFSIVISFIGSFILASFGELILSAIRESEKPLLAIIDLFPSGFKIISGIKTKSNRYNLFRKRDFDKSGIYSELIEMITDKEFLRFKCVTWSLWIIEMVDDIINENDLNINKKNCKFLVSSSDYSILKYSTFIRVQDPSVDLILQRQKKIDKYKENYERRIKLIDDYESKELDFGDLSYILVEYNNNQKEILFFVNDLGPRLRKVGLFSSERYIIEIFEGLFDRAWYEAKNHNKIVDNNLQEV